MIVELRKVFLGDGRAPRIDVWVGGQFVGGMYQPEVDRLVAEVVAHDYAEGLVECERRESERKLRECEEFQKLASPTGG
jgi:hypothetical protein